MSPIVVSRGILLLPVYTNAIIPVLQDMWTNVDSLVACKGPLPADGMVQAHATSRVASVVSKDKNEDGVPFTPIAPTGVGYGPLTPRGVEAFGSVSDGGAVEFLSAKKE